MCYRWPLFGLSVLVVAALALPSAAADPELKQTDSQKIDEILRDMRDLKATAGRVQDELKNLQTREELHHQSLSRDVNERIERVRDFLGGLESRIKRLETELEALHAQATTANRVANYPSAGSGAAAPPLTGPIRLRNTFPEQVSIVISGQSYQLMPGETQLLPAQPAGPFTYEVLGIQAPRTVTLAPNERFTVTVYPR
jgi:hypothetical protein